MTPVTRLLHDIQERNSIIQLFKVHEGKRPSATLYNTSIEFLNEMLPRLKPADSKVYYNSAQYYKGLDTPEVRSFQDSSNAHLTEVWKEMENEVSLTYIASEIYDIKKFSKIVLPWFKRLFAIDMNQRTLDLIFEVVGEKIAGSGRDDKGSIKQNLKDAYDEAVRLEKRFEEFFDRKAISEKKTAFQRLRQMQPTPEVTGKTSVSVNVLRDETKEPVDKTLDEQVPFDFSQDRTLDEQVPIIFSQDRTLYTPEEQMAIDFMQGKEFDEEYERYPGYLDLMEWTVPKPSAIMEAMTITLRKRARRPRKLK